MRTLATEIFKANNNLKPSFMKDIFISKVNPKVRPNNLIVKRHNTTKYGTKSLTTLGSQTWNTLPENIKSETCYSKFKKRINVWFGPQCNCNYCKTTSENKCWVKLQINAESLFQIKEISASIFNPLIGNDVEWTYLLEQIDSNCCRFVSVNGSVLYHCQIKG